MQKLLAQFQQLNEREQKLAVISVVAVVILGFYWLVWSPLNANIDTSRQAIVNQEQLLSWVKNNANKAIQLKQSGGQAGQFRGSLPQAVNQAAGRLNISISRMQPQGEQLMVWVDEAPFNDILSWLQGLEKRGIQIVDLDVAEASDPGMVKIRRLQLGKL